jgi:hypothetical protein
MPALGIVLKLAGIAVIAATIAACSGPPSNPELAGQCENGLKSAYQELDFAKAKGFGGTVDWTKAASLLSAASVQQEFGKYPNCVDKVRRARYYIEQSQK